MGNLVANPRQLLHEGLDPVEHAVFSLRKLVERMFKALGRQTLPQVAGYDAVDQGVELLDALLGPGAQHHADQQAQGQSERQSQQHSPRHDLRKLRQFVDVAGDHQHVAVRQAAGNGANVHRFPIVPVDADSRGGLNRSVDPEAVWQTFEIARDPMPIRAKQARKLDAARILPQSIIDGVQLMIRWVSRNREAYLGKGRVSLRQQIVGRLPIDEGRK